MTRLRFSHAHCDSFPRQTVDTSVDITLSRKVSWSRFTATKDGVVNSVNSVM